MADVIGDGIIDITADTSGFEAAMGPVIKSADATAKKVTTGFSAEFNKVSAAAGALSAQVGGAFGRIGSVANSAIRPLAEVATSFGAIGVAAAGLSGGVVAIGAVVAAAKGLADGALGARDRLEEMGLEVTGDAARDLDSYAAATRDLGIAIDEVRIAAGHAAAGELAVLARTLAANTGAIVQEVSAAAELAGILGDTLTLGASAAVRVLGTDLYDSLTADARAASEAAGEMQAYADALAEASKAAADLNNEMEREAQADEIAGRTEARRQETEAIRLAGITERAEMAETARQRAEVMGQFEEIAQREIDESARTRDAMIADNETKLAAAREFNEEMDSLLGEQVADVEEAAEEESVAWQTVARTIGNTFLAITDDIQALQQQIIDGAREQAREQIAAATAVAEDQAAHDAEAVQAMLDSGTISEQQADAELARIDRVLQADLAAADELGDEERAAAERAFRRSQDLAEGQAVIAAALSAISLIPALAYLGWGAPIAAVGIAGSALGVQLAVIEGQSPPEFPMGRGSTPSPDHSVMALLQPGEPVLTRSGNAMLEDEFGDGAADALNRGARPRGSDSGRTQVDVSIDPRLQRLRIRVDHKMGKCPRRGR